jgi:alanine transaminase
VELTSAGRDGHPANFEDIYLSNGASSGVNTLLHTICAKPETGILVPIPQYPLYTATLAILDARVVPYYLDEENAWGTSLDSIRSAHAKAVSEGTDVKAICVINPGNPTGASLPASDIKAVLQFAAENSLVVIADEVYQTNVFIGTFISFKKALRDLQASEPGKYDDIELASLHSISKGMVGECGHRGGYFELCGFDPEVAQEVYKFVSIQLCPPVLGQCIVEMMVNPPREGEESYPLYREEYEGIFGGLRERSSALFEAFKKMEGVKCDEPQVRPPFLPRRTIALLMLIAWLIGLHVPLPHHHAPGQSHRAGEKRRP